MDTETSHRNLQIVLPQGMKESEGHKKGTISDASNGPKIPVCFCFCTRTPLRRTTSVEISCFEPRAVRALCNTWSIVRAV